MHVKRTFRGLLLRAGLLLWANLPPALAAQEPPAKLDEVIERIRKAHQAVIERPEDEELKGELARLYEEAIERFNLGLEGLTGKARTSHPDFADPLPAEITGPAQPAAENTPGAAAPRDLPGLADMLIKDKDDPLKKAAALFIYSITGRAEQAEELLKEKPEKPSAVDQWLEVLFLQQTGRTRDAAAEARTLAASWEGKSPFLIRKLTFIAADAPASFGVYTPVENASFPPGELVALYYELEGFQAEQRKETYTVRFQVDFGIFDDGGREVWRKGTPDIASHTTRSMARDLFLTSAFYAPSTLGGGRYSLRLEVTDLVSRMRAVAETAFQIRSPR